jgi:hypothetical protein
MYFEYIYFRGCNVDVIDRRDDLIFVRLLKLCLILDHFYGVLGVWNVSAKIIPRVLKHGAESSACPFSLTRWNM